MSPSGSPPALGYTVVYVCFSLGRSVLGIKTPGHCLYYQPQWKRKWCLQGSSGAGSLGVRHLMLWAREEVKGSSTASAQSPSSLSPYANVPTQGH